MAFRKILFATGLISIFCLTNANAQHGLKTWDFNFIAGVNLGATTPVPIPGQLNITGYQPKFNPRLGAGVAYYFNDHWGVGAGLTVDWKRMTVRTRVDHVHLSIDVPSLGTLTGYVTGRNKTHVRTVYLTQPIYGTYRFNHKWQVKAGIYLAENISRKFDGSVSNVDIVVETPISQERQIPYATLDYSDHVRKFDMGIIAGGEFRVNRIVGIYADFSWGLTPYFSGDVPIHFTMRNLYLSLGATFRIN